MPHQDIYPQRGGGVDILSQDAQLKIGAEFRDITSTTKLAVW